MATELRIGSLPAEVLTDANPALEVAGNAAEVVRTGPATPLFVGGNVGEVLKGGTPIRVALNVVEALVVPGGALTLTIDANCMYAFFCPPEGFGSDVSRLVAFISHLIGEAGLLNPLDNMNRWMRRRRDWRGRVKN